jgi:UTP--glucose-1-phosphate uridylyltransferase
MVVVVLAGGLGTRMREVTGGAPKEMLPYGGRSILAHVVEEALMAPSERVRVVGSPAKPQISAFVASQENQRLEYAEQAQPLGVADAARVGAEARQPALILNGDTLYRRGSPVLKLAAILEEGAWAAVAVREVPQAMVTQYGVVAVEDSGKVVSVVEKPAVEAAPSRWAVAGRFALSREAVDALYAMRTNRPGDPLTLTDLIEEGLQAGRRVVGVRLGPDAEMYDCGGPEGYAAALRSLEE